MRVLMDANNNITLLAQHNFGDLTQFELGMTTGPYIQQSLENFPELPNLACTIYPEELGGHSELATTFYRLDVRYV
jgi:hypothetical protein